MLNTLESLRELLKETFLKDADIAQIKIPLTNEIAIAIKVDLENSLNSWIILKDFLSQTQRYPVINACWGASIGCWEDNIKSEDFFSRFYFSEEYPDMDLSPQTIIARANLYSDLDLDTFLNERAQLNTYDLDAQILTELESTKSQFGSAPSELEIKEHIQSGAIATIVDLEHYLFDWEIQQQIATKPELGSSSYLDWYQPKGQTLALLLLPTPHSWEALAYLAWFGGSKAAIPLLTRWHQTYGAKLVCHYGTMLQLLVKRKPKTPQEALELSIQQVLLAPCTTMLSGISIRNHARSLLIADRWFIHERP
ncbi:DUF4253 domain-containing protein [Pseudanabaena biceps]|nr:DUF4253 domain-containing protein [Pseudanabaena biceps]